MYHHYLNFFIAVTHEIIAAFELILSHLKIMLQDKETQSVPTKSAADQYIDLVNETDSKKSYHFPKPGHVSILE